MKNNFYVIIIISIITIFFDSLPQSYASSTLTSPPRNIRIQENKNALLLTWKKPLQDVDGYRIYRSTSRKKLGKVLITINDAGINSFTDSSVKTNKKYYYTVRSFLDAGAESTNKKQVYKSVKRTSVPAPTQPISLLQSNDSIALIKKFSTAIVKLTCSVTSDTASQGSGTLFFNPEDGTYTIFTNYHVVKTEDGNAPFCIVTVYPNSPLLDGALAYISQAGSFKDFGELDISAFNIEPIDDSVGQSLFNQPLSKPLNNLEKFALDGKTTMICSEPQIGEKVFILGYPSVGGNSLTVTDGIVAGIENDDTKKYYKTSAKVEHGNSGGAAILENGCFLGIPTLAILGSLESLAYILPLQ